MKLPDWRPEIKIVDDKTGEVLTFTAAEGGGLIKVGSCFVGVTDLQLREAFSDLNKQVIAYNKEKKKLNKPKRSSKNTKKNEDQSKKS